MFHRNPGSWNEMSRRDRSTVLVLAAVQLALAAAAWVDLARRGRDQVLGSKRTWALVICVNFIGPLTYFVFGRRRTPLSPSVGELLGGETPDSHVQIASETITVDAPDSATPIVFPVTTASETRGGR